MQILRFLSSTIIFFFIGFLLIGCGSKLPDPTPLTDFSSSAILEQVWSGHPNDGNQALLFKLSPATDNDFLYVVGNDGEVSAINTLTGKKAWTKNYNHDHFSSNVGLDGEAVYLGTDSGNVLKLDKKTGALLWAKFLPSSVIAAPLPIGDKVFVKSINGEVTCLNAQTGSPIWNYQQTLPSLILRDTSDLVAHQQLLFAGFSNGGLIAFEQLSGNIRWIKQLSAPEGKTDVERMADVAATPQIIDHVVYAGSYQGKILAFNAQTQDTLWSADVSTYNDFSLSDRALFAGDNDGNILAIDRHSGAILWKQDALRYRYVTAPIYIGNDIIALGDKEGYLHLLNAKDGHFVARTKVHGDGILTAPLYRRGYIIVQTNSGRLYAYRLKQIT